MSNKLIDSFLSNPETNEFYKNYLLFPTEENKEIIEERFKIHAKKIKILTYFSKVLFFEAQRFDKKLRSESTKSPLIVDNENVSEDTLFLNVVTI